MSTSPTTRRRPRRVIGTLTALLLATTGIVAIGLGEAATAAGVTSSTITSPGNGSHWFTTDSNPAADVDVTGHTNGTTGDSVTVRCYFRNDEWSEIAAFVPVDANGDFSTQMTTDWVYSGACTLRAVPDFWPSGASTAAFAGPRVYSERMTTSRVASGPNAGKAFDLWVLFQGSGAMNEYGSATGNALANSRMLYADGTSGYTFWHYDSSLSGYEDGVRSRIQVDGKNAYGPASAEERIPNATQLAGFPGLTSSASRNASTGSTTIHEADPLVRCPDETYPPSASCTSLISVGVRLERTITADATGRQVHVSDVWRSTDGHAHSVSAHYLQPVNGSLPDGLFTLPSGFKLPWLSATYQTFSGVQDLTGTSHVPASMFVRQDNTAPDGSTALGRGAVTFDTPVATVHRRLKSEVTFLDTIAVPAGGTRTVRHDYVSGTTESQIAAAAAASRIRLNPRRSDGLIRTASSAYVGNDVYNTTGAGQTATAKKKRGKKATFFIAVQNDGTLTDTFRLLGGGNRKGFRVTWFAGTEDVTSQVTHGTYTLRDLAPGQQRVIRLVVKVKAAAKKGIVRSWLLHAAAVHDSTSNDTVAASVKVKK